MARARLTPEEREARRKERSRHSFSEAAYKRRYDPATEGFGNAAQWKQTGTERLGAVPVIEVDADLRLLGLDELPDIRNLHLAFRRASRKAHPDVGGSHEAMQALNDAYERLRGRFASR